VGVLVVVEELELEHAAMGQNEDLGLIDELILRDPYRGMHLAVGSLLRLSDASAPEYSTQGHAILLVQVFDDLGHARSSLWVQFGGREITTF
jgi:hypothetical protein